MTNIRTKSTRTVLQSAAIGLIAVAAALVIPALTGKHSNASANEPASTANKGTTVSDTPLKIYATASPQGDIVRFVQKLADADGSGLKLKLTTSGGSGALDSYELLASGDTDVNFTGHQPYVNAWKAAHPTLDNFDGKARVLLNAFGLYSEKYKSPSELPDGAKILIPNEQTNLPRALFILQDLGLIKLDVAQLDSSPAAVSVSEKSIIENPRHLRLIPTDTVLRAKALPDADASFINGDVALSNGIDPSRALVREHTADNPYANLIYARNDMLDDPRLTLLAKYLTGPEVKQFIEANYRGFVVPDQKLVR